MRLPSKWEPLGTFLLEGIELEGEISLDAENTSLRLFSDAAIWPIQSAATIAGRLHDGTHVTLLDCIVLNEKSRAGSKRTTYLYPHHVVYGEKLYDALGNCTTRVEFLIDDATTLFYDFHAFGVAMEQETEIVQQIVDATERWLRAHEGASSSDHSRCAGPDAIVAYFSGNREILRTSRPRRSHSEPQPSALPTRSKRNIDIQSNRNQLGAQESRGFQKRHGRCRFTESILRNRDRPPPEPARAPRKYEGRGAEWPARSVFERANAT